MNNEEIFCPWCLSSIIASEEGICEECYRKEDADERSRWDNFRKWNSAAHMAVACKIDEAFQQLEEIADEKTLEDFHRRRIICCLEFFDYVDDSLLTAGSREGVARYKQAVRDYATQRIDERTVSNIVMRCKTALPKSADISLLNLRTEFFQFWCGEDVLDWSFSQYFEIVMANVDKFVPHKTLIAVMQKHFEDILSMPVERVGG